MNVFFFLSVFPFPAVCTRFASLINQRLTKKNKKNNETNSVKFVSRLNREHTVRKENLSVTSLGMFNINTRE